MENENFHPKTEYKKDLPVYVCMYIKNMSYITLWKKGFMDIAQKEHCRHNQHDDDDNGIKIKFPFSVFIEQQSL